MQPLSPRSHCIARCEMLEALPQPQINCDPQPILSEAGRLIAEIGLNQDKFSTYSQGLLGRVRFEFEKVRSHPTSELFWKKFYLEASSLKLSVIYKDVYNRFPDEHKEKLIKRAYDAKMITVLKSFKDEGFENSLPLIELINNLVNELSNLYRGTVASGTDYFICGINCDPNIAVNPQAPYQIYKSKNVDERRKFVQGMLRPENTGILEIIKYHEDNENIKLIISNYVKGLKLSATQELQHLGKSSSSRQLLSKLTQIELEQSNSSSSSSKPQVIDQSSYCSLDDQSRFALICKAGNEQDVNLLNFYLISEGNPLYRDTIIQSMQAINRANMSTKRLYEESKSRDRGDPIRLASYLIEVEDAIKNKKWDDLKNLLNRDDFLKIQHYKIVKILSALDKVPELQDSLCQLIIKIFRPYQDVELLRRVVNSVKMETLIISFRDRPSNDVMNALLDYCGGEAPIFKSDTIAYDIIKNILENNQVEKIQAFMDADMLELFSNEEGITPVLALLRKFKIDETIYSRFANHFNSDDEDRDDEE